MSVLETYNNFRQCIVLKVVLDGRVKVTDHADLSREIKRLDLPEVHIDVYHTNHQYYNEHKCNKMRLKFGDVADVTEFISALLPGDIIQEISLVGGIVKIQNANGRTGQLRCRRIGIKVTSVENT